VSEKRVPDVEQAFDKDKHQQLAEAIEKLNPEEAAYFLWKLEIALRKRKIQLVGYLVAMLAWLVGMLFALVYYGTHDGFVGWAFLLPFVVVGVILFAFGKWSDRIGKAKPPENVSVPVDKKR
jgi:peptidoglycan/LPS O-acetylase OafA/YrhL